MSLEDMVGPDGAPPGGAEKTAAMSLEDMVGVDDEPEELPPPKLVVQAGNDRGTGFVVEGDAVLVGRGLDCDVVLNDASVSRKHFRLDRQPDGTYVVHDLGSGNGTKINGVRLAQFDLVDGTTLEAGTTTMVWRQELPAKKPKKLVGGAGVGARSGWDDDGDRTRMTDLAAMELLPDYEKPQAGGGEATSAVAEMDLAEEGGGSKMRVVALVATVLVVLLGGFVGLDAAFDMGIVFSGSAKHVKSADSGDEDEDEDEDDAPDPKALALVDEGLAAFKDAEWHKAQKRFNAALKLDEDLDNATEGLAQARSEIAAFESRGKGESAFEDGDFRGAIDVLSSIPDTSHYYPEARDLLKDARDSYVEAQLAEAKELEDNGDAVSALGAVLNALKVSPEDPDALAMVAEFKAAGVDVAAAQAAAKTAEAAAKAGAGGAAGSGSTDSAGGSGSTDSAGGGTDSGSGSGSGASGGSTTTGSSGGSKSTASSGGAKSSSKSTGSSGGSKSTASSGGTKSSSKSTGSSGGSKSTASSSSSKKSSRSSKSSSSKSSSKKSGTKAAKETKKPSGFDGAFARYGSGDFNGAIAELKAMSSARGSRKDKAKAKRLATAVQSFDTAYSSGMSAAKGFSSPSKAVEALTRARKLDASINGAYAGRIKNAMAKQYAFLANQAMSNKRPGKAGRYARKALALDPGQPSAKSVYTKVQSTAQTWLDNAKSVAKSDPDKAMALLSKVVTVFPQDDARYSEAYKLLNQLASQEEE